MRVRVHWTLSGGTEELLEFVRVRFTLSQLELSGGPYETVFLQCLRTNLRQRFLFFFKKEILFLFSADFGSR
jgi:hypothetical protein